MRNWINNLKIRAKLLLGFGIVSILAAVLGIIGVINMRNINKEYSEMYNNYGIGMAYIGDVGISFNRIRVNMLNLVGDVSEYDKTIETIDKLNQAIESSFKSYIDLAADQEDIEYCDALKKELNNYYIVKDEIQRLSLANRKDEAYNLLAGDADKYALNINSLIDQLFAINVNGGNATTAKLTETANSTQITMIIVIAFIVSIAFALGMYLARIISNPMKELVSISDKLSLGDVNVDIKSTSNDEIGILKKSFSKMVDNIKGQSQAAERIASGDLSITIEEKSDEDVLSKSMNLFIKILKNLSAEADMLSEAAVEGKLSTRADLTKFEGEFKHIVDGMNRTLDAVIAPIQEASDVLQQMSNGNLTVMVNGNYKGDHAKIKDTLNSTIISLNEVINDINSAAEQVAAGARQISDSSIILSQGCTEQASSIEQLTASTEEISSQSKQSADNAKEANKLAEISKGDAMQGNKQMKELLVAMEEINSSSNEISRVIKVIDDIAFQTNILALNAAVEAARAGQHGKGFAVVAEEVRNLAARSANAAKETTEMIEGSISKSDIGTKLANETAKALDSIMEDVEKVANILGEIAVASNEQAMGIEQINQGIMQVSEVVQTNSATSEEGAAASEELSSQAEVLKINVNKFKLQRNMQPNYKLDELSPEVQEFLNNMAEKKKKLGSEIEKSSAPYHSKLSINLDDNKFGKYK